MCTSVAAYALTTSHCPGSRVVTGRLFQWPELGPLRVGSNVNGKLVLFVITRSTLVQPSVYPEEHELSWAVATCGCSGLTGVAAVAAVAPPASRAPAIATTP